jgi:hypothetical protein
MSHSGERCHAGLQLPLPTAESACDSSEVEVDSTVYGPGSIPDVALKKVFVTANLPVKFRQRLALRGVTSVRLVVLMGAGLDEAMNSMARLILASDWSVDPITMLLERVSLSRLWMEAKMWERYNCAGGG